jgi:hypothetical protein
LERSLAPQPSTLVLADPAGGPAGGGPGKGVGRVAWTPVARHRLPSQPFPAPGEKPPSGNSGGNGGGSAGLGGSGSGSGSRDLAAVAAIVCLQGVDGSDGSDWGEEGDAEDAGAPGRFLPGETLPPRKPNGGGGGVRRPIAEASAAGQRLHADALAMKNQINGRAATSGGEFSGGGSSGLPPLGGLRRGGLSALHSPTSSSPTSSSSSAAAAGRSPGVSTASENVCIEAFGVSYFELVAKLAMEDGVLSDAESRVVLLLLSAAASDPGTGAGPLQERMLAAVVAIERQGISKPAVRAFRAELTFVAAEVAKQPDLVQASAESTCMPRRRVLSVAGKRRVTLSSVRARKLVVRVERWLGCNVPSR